LALGEFDRSVRSAGAFRGETPRGQSKHQPQLLAPCGARLAFAEPVTDGPMVGRGRDCRGSRPPVNRGRCTEHRVITRCSRYHSPRSCGSIHTPLSGCLKDWIRRPWILCDVS